MSSGLRDLFAVTVVCALLVLGVVGATSESLEPALFLETITACYERAFAGPLWSYAPAATAGAFGLSLVLALLERAFSGGSRVRMSQAKPLREGRPADAIGEVRARLTESLTREEPDVVTAWDDLLRGAIRLGASDIHVSPAMDRVQITYRVQGDLQEVVSAPFGVIGPLVTRLKVLSHLDTTTRTSPQDGRLVTVVDGQAVEARVSTLPTETGERLVLRILRGGRAVPDIGALGLAENVERSLTAILARPQGILFVTGPVGSGKTTTLYASLQHIATTRARTTSMVTLEDPIERELPFAAQTQISAKGGLPFAATLRSVLRQDPNVLMVGEIRDAETAEIAMQAGLTGHLILTTMHGQSGAGTFARLIDMGIEPFLLLSATIGCLSQRLVRALCPACRQPLAVDPALAERFERAGVRIPEDVTFFGPAGCEHCNGEGFTGRIPIAELLELSETVQNAIKGRAPTFEIEKLAVAAGMVPLLEDGLRRARAGETSLAEIARVAG